MRKPDCIIFDCDGVLVDSEVIGIRLLLEMTAPYGVDMKEEDAVLEFAGRRLKEVIDMLQTRTGQTFPDDLEQRFRERSFEVFQEEVEPVEGIRALLDSLTIPFCVASSGPVDKIRLNLTLTGLIGYFEDRIFSAYDIESWKPDPGIFLHAAREMGFSPERCVVIEDSKAGITAGVRGGFTVFGYAKEHNAKELESEGATVFYNMHELPQLLKLA
ncbi:HAD-IA family hydrolase [Chitinophaga sp. XS-30]|uniref:HAD-IA family hydrolase n=1 Tax=Chitinophaga sp. XS-30 TaxID=2604421 RepID=UPI0011DCDEB9|nr:HAD-IA family hydrolase [Chitinophaga sp. XS-30]QEH42882.1 HAD-IA family hydrolase [Chitinophaga sp. XS-30]